VSKTFIVYHHLTEDQQSQTYQNVKKARQMFSLQSLWIKLSHLNYDNKNMEKFLNFFLTTFFVCACNYNNSSVFADETQGNLQTTNGPYIVIASQDTSHKGYAIYNMDGQILGSGHFLHEDATPRGLAAFDQDSFLVAGHTTNRSIWLVHLDGGKTLFHGSSTFTGNIYGITRANNGKVYAIRSNTIEVLNSQGLILASERIPQTTGACVLNVPRGINYDSINNQLIVTNRNNPGNLLIYDLSTTPASCVAAIALGNQPHGVVSHSDGNYYVATEQNHRIYRVNSDGSVIEVIWDTDISILRRPTGMVELPNGDLLVSSSQNNTVERFTTQGQRVGTEPFLWDVFTRNVSEITIVGQELQQ
jgi:DNA-binding beta-propeller fold protein YncE